jgi:hypothetical protein
LKGGIVTKVVHNKPTLTSKKRADLFLNPGTERQTVQGKRTGTSLLSNSVRLQAAEHNANFQRRLFNSLVGPGADQRGADLLIDLRGDWNHDGRIIEPVQSLARAARIDKK